MPHEETRKIIKVGNSYAVTMPRAWLRYFKLDDKSQVTVISNDTVEIKPSMKEACADAKLRACFYVNQPVLARGHKKRC